MRFKPTSEQEQAVKEFLRSRTLVVNAYAGTGKTATLKLIGDSANGTGTYLAFNNSIAAEARETFPHKVNCLTTHSLAFKSIFPEYSTAGNDKMTKNLNSNMVMKAIDFPEGVSLSLDMFIDQRSLAYLTLGTVRKFLRSQAVKPSDVKVPLLGILAHLPKSMTSSMTRQVGKWADVLWRKMLDPADWVPLGHDGYLKKWALSQPRIFSDFILLDEAQDSNPVILDVLAKQDAKIVYVGDRYQQIYEWRGAINAMETIKTDSQCYLTKSFRFGPQIASAASKLLMLLGSDKPIVGNEDISSRIGCLNPQAILCRTNYGVLAELFLALGKSLRPYLVGNKTELKSMLRDVSNLKQGIPSQHHDFFGFRNWKEVVEISQREEGKALRSFVKMVEDHGEIFILEAIDRTVDDENSADITLSTAHRAKGLEWERVRLAEDFPAPQKENGMALIDRAELRLAYVAVTRGRQEISIPNNINEYFSIKHETVICTPEPILEPCRSTCEAKLNSSAAPRLNLDLQRDQSFTNIQQVLDLALQLVKESATEKFPNGCLSQDIGITKIKNIFPDFNDFGKLCIQLGHPTKGMNYLMSFCEISKTYNLQGKYWILSQKGIEKLEETNADINP